MTDIPNKPNGPRDDRLRMAAMVLPLCRLMNQPAAERALVRLAALPGEAAEADAMQILAELSAACPEHTDTVEMLISGDSIALGLLPLCRRYRPGQLLRALSLDTAVSPEAVEALLTADEPQPPVSAERIRARMIERLSACHRKPDGSRSG